jgi:phosphoribosylaminoimidazole-succinocarboxamide synthase
MLVRKAKVVPFECVVRGYLAGSGWKEYRKQSTVCGIPLPAGLIECQKLPAPIFTPSTKAETGHDENISYESMVAATGAKLAGELRERSLDVYRRAADYAESRGILLADTKFEWGQMPDGSLILIDEALTPDSSRFWPKQFVRDCLETTTWDKNRQPPTLPAEVVEKTRAKYVEAFEKLTGRKFA